MKQKRSKTELFTRYLIQWIREKDMRLVRQWRISKFQMISLAVLMTLTGFVTGALLFTQTNLLKMMGHRPRMIMTRDYTEIKSKVEALEAEAKARDEQMATLEKFITKDIHISDTATTTAPPEAIPMEINTSLPLFAVPPYCCFAMPLEGEYSGLFNPSLGHLGIDIVAPARAVVHAIADGYVLYSGFNKFYGNSVILSHSNNIVSRYLHNSKLLVYTGQWVHKGQPIAIIGNNNPLNSVKINTNRGNFKFSMLFNTLLFILFNFNYYQ